MNTYRKIGPDTWGIQSDDQHEVGSIVTVTLKNGSTKRVTLGEYRGTQYGKHVYTIAQQAPAANTVAVGDLSGILALFDRAKQHLKRPAIVLGVPALGPDVAIRINIAGPRAKVPGSLTVLDADKNEDDSRDWFGRVLLDGTFQAKSGTSPAIADRLRAFAADPVKIACEHAKLTGRCCFCNIRLTDPRSTIVGYGRICADHFGLPWGSEKHTFETQAQIDADEAYMKAAEIKADREETIRDERNKHKTRSLMEMAAALEARS